MQFYITRTLHYLLLSRSFCHNNNHHHHMFSSLSHPAFFSVFAFFFLRFFLIPFVFFLRLSFPSLSLRFSSLYSLFLFVIISRFFRAFSLCLSISCASSDVYLFPPKLHCSVSNYLFLVRTFFLSYFLSFSSKFLVPVLIHIFFFSQAIFRRSSTLLFQLVPSVCKLSLLCYIMLCVEMSVHMFRFADSIALFKHSTILLLNPFWCCLKADGYLLLNTVSKSNVIHIYLA